MKNAPLILLSLIFFPTFIFGQQNWRPGYVITLEGNQLSGQIDDREWKAGPYRVNFRTGENQVAITYQPDELIAFEVAKKKYVAGHIEVESGMVKTNTVIYTEKPTYRKDLTFVQQLIGGERNLYRYVDRSNKKHFLIGEQGQLTVLQNYVYLDNSGRKKIRDVKYRRLMYDYLPDCDELKQELNQLPYEEKAMIGVVKNWTKCQSNELAYERPREKYGVSFAPVVGFGRTIAHFNNVNPRTIRQDWESDSGLFFGGSVRLILPGRRKRFSINLDVLYTSYSLSGLDFQEDRESTTIFNSIDISEKSLLFYLGGQIDIAIGKMTFPVGFGIAKGTNLGHSISLTNTRRIFGVDNLVRNFLDKRERLNDKEIGGYADVGLRLRQFQVSLRYQHTINIYELESYDMALTRFSLLTRYHFGG